MRSLHYLSVETGCYAIISADRESFKVEHLRKETGGWLKEEGLVVI